MQPAQPSPQSGLGQASRSKELSVCDPDTGSGAFPLAAAHRDAAQTVLYRPANQGGRTRGRFGLPAFLARAVAPDLELTLA